MTEATRKSFRKTGVGVPPYVPFGTFRNFLDKISARIPSQIDQSVMPRTSRAIRVQLEGALGYMGLVSSDGSRTETLTRLAKSRDKERMEVLGGVIRTSYPFLFGAFDLAACTTAQLGQEFKRRGASGNTIRKCIAFFIAACREAGIEVSPHIKPFWGIEAAAQKSAASSKTTEPWVVDPDLQTLARGDASTAPDPLTWRTALLLKFPNFDPTWSDEIKSKWFDDFAKLMEYIGGTQKHP